MLPIFSRNKLISLSLGRKFVQFLRYPNPRFISTTSESVDYSEFTRDYLRNSCGLSSETALSASQKLRLKSIDKPNSVLNLFKGYGLSETQITKLISKHPMVLVSDPEKNLKPKIDFLETLGVSGPNIADFISSHPSVLVGGLKNQIATYEYLRSFLGTDEDVGTAVNRSTMILRLNAEKVTRPNIVFLSNIGVPKSNISKLLLYQPRCLTVKVERFSEIVNVVKEMEFDPTGMMFVEATRIMLGMSKATWETKLTMYAELGWSKEDTLAMFKRCPNCMRYSEKKIRRAVGFYVKVLKWKLTEISLNAELIGHSMDKRVIPRCAVLEVLKSAGVLRELNLKNALRIAEKQFLEKYVTKYQEEVPDVVKAHKVNGWISTMKVAEHSTTNPLCFRRSSFFLWFGSILWIPF